MASTIRADEFERAVLDSTQPVLVDFSAAGCLPCVAMSPVLEQLEWDFERRARILQVDIVAAPDLAARYHVQQLPCLVFFSRGKEVGRIVGTASRGTLSTLLEVVGAGS